MLSYIYKIMYSYTLSIWEILVLDLL